MKYQVCLFLFFLVKFQALGQELNLSSYLPNIVDLGGGNFGIITSDLDDKTISFITTRSSDSDFFNGISVKFYNIDFESTAHLVKTFVVGKNTIGLYQCEKPENFTWRIEHYNYFSSNSGTFRTFLDNGKSDNQWSNYRETISLVDFSNGIATLQMGNQPLYNPGMPILNEQGSIVGIIASKITDENTFTFEAIDFSIIEKFLYDFAKCKYFKMILFGQKMDLCTQKEKVKLSNQREDEKNYRQNKRYFITAAPAFNLGVLDLPSEKPESNYAGFGYTAGINLYLWPDQPTRLSFKPRYAQYRVGLYEGTPNILDEIDFQVLNLNSFEIPVMVESVYSYNRKNNWVVALGYVPSFNTSSELIYHINGEEFLENIKPGSSIFHKLLVELTFENRISRWGFYYGLQFNHRIDPDFLIEIQNQLYQPFEGQKSFSHYFGAEFSWRLWGNWLVKEKL